ncbi:helix-turn-helix transcriptional regulator [Methylobacterium sp. WL122]|nr:helix-turn-helix transcriptional regulator [Methylobacterium sp. WL122]
MKPELNYAIGLRAKRARERAGFTQEKLAELIERTKEAVSNIERGVNLPTIDTLERICGATEVPIAFMFEDSGSNRATIDLKARLDTAFFRLDNNSAKLAVEMIELMLRHSEPQSA